MSYGVSLPVLGTAVRHKHENSVSDCAALIALAHLLLFAVEWLTEDCKMLDPEELAAGQDSSRLVLDICAPSRLSMPTAARLEKTAPRVELVGNVALNRNLTLSTNSLPSHFYNTLLAPHATHPNRTEMTQPTLESSGNNSTAASHQDQGHPTNQNLPPRADATEKVTLQQLMEQGLLGYNLEERSSIAIGDVWPSTYRLTDKEREKIRQALDQPLPEGDDFADEPVSKPYNPADPTPDWAKSEAWIEEKDSKGDWHIRFSRPVTNTV